MKLYKFANQLGVDPSVVQALPSAHGLRPSTDISSLMQQKLTRELRARTAGPPTGDLPAAKPGPAVTAASEELPTPPSTDEPLAVHQLARQLGTYKDDVIDVLRSVTDARLWTADSVVTPEVAALARVEYARRKAPGTEVRRATTARPRRSRSGAELAALRVQLVKKPESRGEEVLAAILRKLPAGLALIGVDVATYDKTLDVDAIVILPNLLATVEVKDTVRVGTISACVNGPWEVDGQPFQGHGVGPTNQAIQQARVLGSARRERPELASLKRIPATIGVFGKAHFETRPLYEITADCFSYNVDDAVDALNACAERLHAVVTVGHVQALFAWLGVSSSMTFTREELQQFGFQEYAA